MYLTFEKFEDISPNVSDIKRIKYFSYLQRTFDEFNINSPLRIAAFIAQILHESGNFRYVEEIASGSAYEYRKDLGNLTEEALQIAHNLGTTSGKLYKGRGLIQITGFYNYKACGKALKLDLIHKPLLLTDPLQACRSAGWFWESHRCNTLADKGYFDTITKCINGGYNGKIERDRNYLLCKQILECK